MFKSCCFGGGPRLDSASASPELSDKRHLKTAPANGGLNDKATGGGEEGDEDTRVVDLQIVSAALVGPQANAAESTAAEKGAVVNSSDQLPKDTEDSGGKIFLPFSY